MVEYYEERDGCAEYTPKEIRQRLLMFGAILAFIVIADYLVFKGIVALVRWIF